MRGKLQDCTHTIMDGFELSAAYDAVMGNADPDDVKFGSSTTRVRDVVNRGRVFDGLYLHPPVLKACCRIINEPFRLSTIHARTLRPGLPAQNLHVDFERDAHGWTMVGFIFMVDELRNDNGATRFVPGSQLWSVVSPELALGEFKANYPGQVLACGPAGSMIVFNGSVWHEHTMNRSSSLDVRYRVRISGVARDQGKIFRRVWFPKHSRRLLHCRSTC